MWLASPRYSTAQVKTLSYLQILIFGGEEEQSFVFQPKILLSEAKVVRHLSFYYIHPFHPLFSYEYNENYLPSFIKQGKGQ